jgi:hypothetical protein
MKNKIFVKDEVTGKRKTNRVPVREVIGKWKTHSLWGMKWRENEKQKGYLWEKLQENEKQNLCDRRSDRRKKNKICVCQRLNGEWKAETEAMSKKARKNQRRKSVAVQQSNYKNVAATGQTVFLYGNYITFHSPSDCNDNACWRIKRLQLRLPFGHFSRWVTWTCEWNSVKTASAVFLQTVKWDRPCVGSEAKVMLQ